MKNWILLSYEDAELAFWNNFDFPLNFWGESAWEIRCGDRGRCKYDWDRYVEKNAFQIFYNPRTNKFRAYLKLYIHHSVKIIDPDQLYLKNPEFISKIDRFWFDGRDFKSCLSVKSTIQERADNKED